MFFNSKFVAMRTNLFPSYCIYFTVWPGSDLSGTKLENLCDSEKAKLATPTPPLGVVIHLPIFSRSHSAICLSWFHFRILPVSLSFFLFLIFIHWHYCDKQRCCRFGFFIVTSLIVLSDSVSVSTTMATMPYKFHAKEGKMCSCFLPSNAKDSHELHEICKS